MNPEDRYGAARALYLEGRQAEARAGLEALAGEEMDPALGCRVQSLLGTLCREGGDVVGALEAFDLARELLPSSGEYRSAMAGIIPFEESLALWQQGSREDAIAHLLEAQEAFLAAGDRQHTTWALLWRAWLLAEIGEVGGADVALQNAKRYIDTTEDSLRHALTAARVALARRDASAALEYIVALNRHAGIDMPQDILTLSTVITAESLAIRGNLGEAMLTAKSALVLARGCHDSRVSLVVKQTVERINLMRVGR